MNRPSPHNEHQLPPDIATNRLQELLDETAAATYKDIMAIVEARLELLKIEVTQKISLIGAAVIIGVIGALGVAFLLTTLALLLGEVTGHTFLGFFIVSLLFFGGLWFFTHFRPTLLQHFIQNLLLSTNDTNK